jgi:hypothetical protein
LTRFGRRPVATGPLHPRGCHCPHCDRTSRAEVEAERLRAASAAAASSRAVAAAQTRKEIKAAAAREERAAEVMRASRAVGDLREAKARADADPKAGQLRVLRAEGKTLAEAIEIIEREAAGCE